MDKKNLEKPSYDGKHKINLKQKKYKKKMDRGPISSCMFLSHCDSGEDVALSKKCKLCDVDVPCEEMQDHVRKIHLQVGGLY